MQGAPCVLDCWHMANADYLLRVVVEDLKTFTQVVHSFYEMPFVDDCQATIVLEQVKEAKTLPIAHLKKKVRTRRKKAN